jgi:hypothetical protein
MQPTRAIFAPLLRPAAAPRLPVEVYRLLHGVGRRRRLTRARGFYRGAAIGCLLSLPLWLSMGFAAVLVALR